MFEAVPNCSGGKVFKNCQHQVINNEFNEHDNNLILNSYD